MWLFDDNNLAEAFKTDRPHHLFSLRNVKKVLSISDNLEEDIIKEMVEDTVESAIQEELLGDGKTEVKE